MPEENAPVIDAEAINKMASDMNQAEGAESASGKKRGRPAGRTSAKRALPKGRKRKKDDEAEAVAVEATAEVAAPKRRGRKKADADAATAVDAAPAKTCRKCTRKKAVKEDAATEMTLPFAEEAAPQATGTVFTYRGAAGAAVFLAGEFNGWSPNATPMIDACGCGEYACEIQLEPGQYAYKLVVNGEWILDPANDMVVANEFGTSNNLKIVL